MVILPQQLAQEVIAKAYEHEELEAAIKRQLAVEDVSPGKYYPFSAATREMLQREGERQQLQREPSLLTLAPREGEMCPT